MNEALYQSKLSMIFRQFEVLIQNIKNDERSFILPGDLVRFRKKYDSYAKNIKNGGKHDFDSLLDLYNKFKIYIPSVGKNQYILKSIDQIFQSLHSKFPFNEDYSDENKKDFIKPLLLLFRNDCNEQIQLMKQKINKYQIEIAKLKLQKQVLDQQVTSKIIEISNYVEQITDFYKSINPELIKKRDDHNVRMICDLIYIIDKMQ